VSERTLRQGSGWPDSSTAPTVPERTRGEQRSKAKLRILFVCSHPTQYSAPVFRAMARDPRLDLHVAYCSLQGVKPGLDPGFGREHAWDVPLLDGYSWTEVPNRSPRPGVDRFFGLVNLGLYALVRRGGFDAVIASLGYAYASFWLVAAAAKAGGAALLFGTDAHGLAPRVGHAWKAAVKKRLWPRVFGLADTVLVASSGGVRLMQSLGFPADRVVSTLFVVDNERWLAASREANRDATRAHWGVPAEAPVALFSGKLQPWKRPEDLLRAFARASLASAHLVFAGDGPLGSALADEARALGIAERTHFLGFVNQSALPEVYAAADLLVLPSQYEAFGVVVNEAMLCGRPVVVSDHVGARFDLVREGETGFVYRCGDVESLAAILLEVLPDRERLVKMGEAGRRHMQTWSPEVKIEAVIEAVEKAIHRRAPPFDKLTGLSKVEGRRARPGR
jgi:glycosyltransferase involved in cell wall biosynthesis